MFNSPKTLTVLSCAIIGVVMICLASLSPWLGTATAQQESPAAQSPKPAPIGRFQISALGIQKSAPDGTLQASSVAYIVDTQTGDVFMVVVDQHPKFIGTAKKEEKKEDAK
jgi:hypothetical protein